MPGARRVLQVGLAAAFTGTAAHLAATGTAPTAEYLAAAVLVVALAGHVAPRAAAAPGAPSGPPAGPRSPQPSHPTPVAPTTPRPPTPTKVAAARYLWSLPLGRLAVACVAIGLIGLTLHYWLPVLTVLALPRDTRWGAA